MALLLDGVTEVINHGDVASIDLATTNTIMFWLKPTSLTSNDSLVSKGNYAGSASPVVIFTGGATDSLRVTWAGGGSFGNVASWFTDGVWTHTAMVYDGAGATNADRLQVYKDGVAQTITFTGTVPAAYTDGGTDPFRVGYNGFSGFHNGAFAHVRVWSVALTPAEVLLEWQAPRPVRGNQLLLAASYEPGGVDGLDYSGNDYHGTLTGTIQVAGPPILDDQYLGRQRFGAVFNTNRRHRNQFRRTGPLLPRYVA